MSALEPGLAAAEEHVVTEVDTALAVGSGDVPVLATPRLVAWMEAATVSAVADALAGGDTTVGTRIEVDHVAASALGARIEVGCALLAVDGRVLSFAVTAHDGDGVRIAGGTIIRVVVGRERFLARLTQPA
ncbi:thioesterase family protein [Jiangella asiatica]|uniref:Thioesterase n=1 Tax=Jiangella asiatica TaxID=2530372 RepID=A0A4R5DUR5_9ACTN|nr:hotdog domain-containing protein [Jiangella asiatica]TDE14955.1 thioesterase [Jiangella asiatica]